MSMPAPQISLDTVNLVVGILKQIRGHEILLQSRSRRNEFKSAINSPESASCPWLLAMIDKSKRMKSAYLSQRTMPNKYKQNGSWRSCRDFLSSTSTMAKSYSNGAALLPVSFNFMAAGAVKHLRKSLRLWEEPDVSISLPFGSLHYAYLWCLLIVVDLLDCIWMEGSKKAGR